MVITSWIYKDTSKRKSHFGAIPIGMRKFLIV